MLSLSIGFLSACAQLQHERHTHGGSNIYKANPQVLNCSKPDGHHIVTDSATCPIGGENFSVLTYAIYSTYGEYSDLEEISYIRFPLPLSICPANGLVIDEDKYSPQALEKRKHYIESAEFKALYAQKHASYFLLAKQLEALNEDPNGMAWWFYLRATWEASHCGDQKRYFEYANLVIDRALKAKKAKEPLTKQNALYWDLSLIIPEMYRRMGNFDAAKQQLDKLPEFQLESKDEAEYFKAAKDNLLKAVLAKNKEQIRRVAKKEAE